MLYRKVINFVRCVTFLSTQNFGYSMNGLSSSVVSGRVLGNATGPLASCFPSSTSLDKSDIPVTLGKNKTHTREREREKEREREREYVSRICVSRVLVGFILVGDISLSARRYRASPGSKTFRPYADKP